jgi:hypothetical protein
MFDLFLQISFSNCMYLMYIDFLKISQQLNKKNLNQNIFIVQVISSSYLQE